MTEIGPVQMLAVGFAAGAKFEGRIIDELVRLESERTIRVLDLLFVAKDTDSDELVVLDHQAESLGTIACALLGFDFKGDLPSESAPSEDGAPESSFGMTRADVEAVGRRLDRGEAAGFLLIEHVWAKAFKTAIREAGGVPLADAFLTPETVAALEPELAAMASALDDVPRNS